MKRCSQERLKRPVRVVRRRPFVSLVVSLLALFVASSGWGYAATGGSFILGKTNRTSRTTGLAAGVKRGPALAVTNTGGGRAANFTVKAGVPPFAVNSAAKVAKLNADALDGLDGTALQRRITGTCAAGSAIRIVNEAGTVTCQSAGTSSSPAPAAWSLTGNKGTNPATDFLGTTDAQPLIVKTNNKEALRVDAAGRLGVGTGAGPAAEVEASTLGSSGIALLGRSTTTGVVGILGSGGVCGGTVAVIGCGGTTGNGVLGFATAGIGVSGISATRGVVGTLGIGIPCPGTYAVGGCNGAASGILGDRDIGVTGNSASRGVVGTLNGGSCFGVYAVGGCAAGAGIGVFGNSASRGVVGTLNGASCAGVYAVGGCSTGVADGVYGVTSDGSQGTGNPGGGVGVRAVNTSVGNIFVAESPIGTRRARIDHFGNAYFNGGAQTGGADYAESMRTTDDSSTLEPGDVLAIDPQHGQAVRKSREPNSRLLIGVYSTKPTILAVGDHGIDDSRVGEVPVAMLGIVPTKVSAENGPIHAGDLLTTAGTPGYAMKASPVVVGGVAIYPTGTILGKALEPLAQGKGAIKVLVTLR
jgi:hypothetical protein